MLAGTEEAAPWGLRWTGTQTHFCVRLCHFFFVMYVASQSGRGCLASCVVLHMKSGSCQLIISSRTPERMPRSRVRGYSRQGLDTQLCRQGHHVKPEATPSAEHAHQAAPSALVPGVASAGPLASSRGGAAARSSESAIARRNAGRCSTKAVTCPPGTHRSSLPGQWRACTTRHMLGAVHSHALTLPILDDTVP